MSFQTPMTIAKAIENIQSNQYILPATTSEGSITKLLTMWFSGGGTPSADLVGETLDRCKSNDTVLMIISDHGFNSFRCGVDLNRWLEENGYLKPFRLRNIPARPRAKAARLEAVRDTNGERVILKVHRTDKVYSGPATTLAPDLVIGYCRNYRASWATCLGDMTREILLDNDSVWSADHCADASEVPGVLFSNCNCPGCASPTFAAHRECFLSTQATLPTFYVRIGRLFYKVLIGMCRPSRNRSRTLKAALESSSIYPSILCVKRTACF